MMGHGLSDLDSLRLDGKGRLILKSGQSRKDACNDFNDEFYICKIVMSQEEDVYLYLKIEILNQGVLGIFIIFLN